MLNTVSIDVTNIVLVTADMCSAKRVAIARSTSVVELLSLVSSGCEIIPSLASNPPKRKSTLILAPEADTPFSQSSFYSFSVTFLLRYALTILPVHYGVNGSS